MYVIGLTGGIGSGKSTVSAFFKTLGVPVINADSIAKTLTAPHMPAYQVIFTHCGASILDRKGYIQRKKLRDIIFDSPLERVWLEEVLHPLIAKEIEKALHGIKAPYCIIEIPLLNPGNRYHFIDRVLVVDLEPTLQIDRLMKRDKTTRTQIQKIINAQITRDARLDFADDVIDNTSDPETLFIKVKTLHQRYLKRIGGL